MATGAPPDLLAHADAEAAVQPAPAKRPKTGHKSWVHESLKTIDEKRVKCLYCEKELSNQNITRLKEHLLNKKVCPYLDSEQAQLNPDPDVLEAMASGGLHKHGKGGLGVNGRDYGAGRRERAMMDRLEPSEQGALAAKFAEMVYHTKLPYEWVEHPAAQDFFRHLQPGFKLPTQSHLIGLINYLFGEAQSVQVALQVPPQALLAHPSQLPPPQIQAPPQLQAHVPEPSPHAAHQAHQPHQ